MNKEKLQKKQLQREHYQIIAKISKELGYVSQRGTIGLTPEYLYMIDTKTRKNEKVYTFLQKCKIILFSNSQSLKESFTHEFESKLMPVAVEATA